MWLPFLVFRSFTAGDGHQPQLGIHIFMYRQGTQNNAFSFQIGPHHPITVNTVVLVIDSFDLVLGALFLFLICRLPLLLIVIVSIREDI